MTTSFAHQPTDQPTNGPTLWAPGDLIRGCRIITPMDVVLGGRARPRRASHLDESTAMNAELC